MSLRKIVPSSGEGFTLIEVLVALAILAICLRTAFAVFGDAQERADSDIHLARATREAESIIDGIGLTYPIKLGRTAGSTADGFRWEMKVTEFAEGGGPTGTSDQPWVTPFEIDLRVYWPGDDVTRWAQLHTVKLAAGLGMSANE
jgi:prepilin-type N-terminal cleavage/methylation domain-containing protein